MHWEQQGDLMGGRGIYLHRLPRRGKSGQHRRRQQQLTVDNEKGLNNLAKLVNEKGQTDIRKYAVGNYSEF